MWLIGLVLAPVTYLLGWQFSISPALGLTSWTAPAPLFPWQMPQGAPFPNGLALTIGVLAFGLISLKLIADLVDGQASTPSACRRRTRWSTTPLSRLRGQVRDRVQCHCS